MRLQVKMVSCRSSKVFRKFCLKSEIKLSVAVVVVIFKQSICS